MLTSRCYESEHDLQQMQAMLMAARAATDDWRYAHVGELMWNFFMVACHLNPQEFIRLWHDAAGKLAGYAILGEDPSIDWQVLPEYEWCGIEAEVLAWVEARLAELRQADPQRWSGHLVSGARQDNARRIAFLEQHGFRYSGEFAEVNMLRSLAEPIPEERCPPAARCAPCWLSAGDIANRAAAQREVWQPWTVGNVSDDDYAGLDAAAGLPARARCGCRHAGRGHPG